MFITTKFSKRFDWAALVFSILFWMVKRYNKMTKIVNVWPRSEKDLRTYGVSSQVTACMSRDNRVHLRYKTWSIYIGKPQSFKPAKAK